MVSNIMTGPGVKAPADYIEEVMSSVKSKNAAEPEFVRTPEVLLHNLRSDPAAMRREYWVAVDAPNSLHNMQSIAMRAAVFVGPDLRVLEADGIDY